MALALLSVGCFLRLTREKSNRSAYSTTLVTRPLKVNKNQFELVVSRVTGIDRETLTR